MYKRFKITKKYEIIFEKFPSTRKYRQKPISTIYKPGIRCWYGADSYNYTIVFGTFRIIFSQKVVGFE
jgi:hypothetical protein